MIVHPGFDVLGAAPILDGLDDETAQKRREEASQGDWTGLSLDRIAIEWTFTDEFREREVMIEGVTVRVVAGGVAEPKPSLLLDLIDILEERDSVPEGDEGEAHQALVERTANFVLEHGPLGLCPEHGEPPGHQPYCELLDKKERVEHVVRFAEQCRAAVVAARTLRRDRPIGAEERACLPLDPAPPPVDRLIVRTEDWERLRRRLADPIVDDWRRLEAWIERLGYWSEGSLGVLPALVRQLRAECHRAGAQRACRNHACKRLFVPRPAQQRYCGHSDCERTRRQRRFAKLPKCPSCRRAVSKKLARCRYCDTPLPMPSL